MAPGAIAEPYTETYQTQGFLTCGFNLVAVGFMACSVMPNDDAVFIQDITFSGNPTSIETVLTWDATTPAGEVLRLLLSKSGDATLVNVEDEQGSSPLAASHVPGPGGFSAGDQMLVRVFPGDMVELPCVERPIIGGCTMGVGAAFMQPFTLTTTITYA